MWKDNLTFDKKSKISTGHRTAFNNVQKSLKLNKFWVFKPSHTIYPCQQSLKDSLNLVILQHL